MSAEQIVINAEYVGYPDFHRIADAVEGVHSECDRSSCCFRMVADEIRGQIAPPKPDEPQGLGAVVADAEGVVWVKVHDHWRRPDMTGIAWHDLRAVKVLSEGWSE